MKRCTIVLRAAARDPNIRQTGFGTKGFQLDWEQLCEEREGIFGSFFLKLRVNGGQLSLNKNRISLYGNQCKHLNQPRHHHHAPLLSAFLFAKVRRWWLSSHDFARAGLVWERRRHHPPLCYHNSSLQRSSCVLHACLGLRRREGGLCDAVLSGTLCRKKILVNFLVVFLASLSLVIRMRHGYLQCVPISVWKHSI